jgi:hypothetical protein
VENIGKDAYRISCGCVLLAEPPRGNDSDRITQGLVTWQAWPYARTTWLLVSSSSASVHHRQIVEPRSILTRRLGLDLAADQAAFAVSGRRGR